MNKNIMIIIAIVTFLFCAVISIDLIPWLRGPSVQEWRWPYLYINTWTKAYLPILLISIVLILFKKFDQSKLKNPWPILFAVVVLSFLWELSVIYFSRAGIGVLLHRITDPGLNGYYTAGLQIKDLHGFITDYPWIVLDLPMHAKGHPPGMDIFFYFVNQLIPISNQYLAFGMGVGFALLNSLAVIPLYFATKNYRSIFLYITIPALALFLPLPDGFFAFFGILAWCLLVYKKYFFAGLVFAFGLFFSYSILPVLFFLLFLKPKKIFFLPIIIYFLLFWQTFIAVIGGQADRNYFVWTVFNLIDFFIYLGFPLMLLLFFSFKKSWTYLLGIIILTLSGVSRAETGRIWLPLMGFLIIPVAVFLKEKKFGTNFVMIILALQFIQTLFIQEFWVPLW